MGLNQNGLDFLLYANQLHVDFRCTATIGRQELHFSRPQLLDRFRAFGMPKPDNWTLDGIFLNGYADGLLAYLGADDVYSFDAFDRDGASNRHDFNEPISDQVLEGYSLVMDGGSLEHVFNVKQAFQNALSMVELNGHYLAITPTNNHMGHGFYQFGPDLFFHLLSPVNGYRLIDVFAYQDYQLVDPRRLPDGKLPLMPWHRLPFLGPDGQDIPSPLSGDTPTYLLVLAQRMEIVPILKTWPQQRIYPQNW